MYLGTVQYLTIIPGMSKPMCSIKIYVSGNDARISDTLSYKFGPYLGLSTVLYLHQPLSDKIVFIAAVS
jgi:hypothetical protein